MKTILAITCSTHHAGVACLHGNEVNVVINKEGNQHSETILSLIRKSLCSIPLSQIDCIAVDIGPGSFMGIRTAVATAQGLAFAQNIPIYSINSLHLLALSVIEKQNEQNKTHMLTALDARRQEWYFAVWKIISNSSHTKQYSLDQDMVSSIQAPIIISPEHYLDEKKFSHSETIFAGHVWYDADQCPQQYLQIEKNIENPHSQDVYYPDVAILAKIASDNPKYWHHCDLLNPLYVRENVATPMNSG